MLAKKNATSTKPAHIAQPSSGEDCAHCPWPVKKWSCDIRYCLPHCLCPAQRSSEIGHRLQTMPLACTQWSTDVGRGLPASPFSYIEWTVDVKNGLHKSPLDYTQWATDVKCGLHLSFVACTHWLAYVGCGLPTSSISCTHLSVDVRRGLPALSIAFTYWSVKTWPTRIVSGLHLLDERRRMQRHWSMSNKQHAYVHAVQNPKSENHPSCLIRDSSIFHPLFTTFPFHIVHFINFVTFTVCRISKNILFV